MSIPIYLCLTPDGFHHSRLRVKIGMQILDMKQDIVLHLCNVSRKLNIQAPQHPQILIHLGFYPYCLKGIGGYLVEDDELSVKIAKISSAALA